MRDELRDLRDWLPYSPESRVELTYVEQGSRRPFLRLTDIPGTARTHVRRAYAEGEGIWWIRGHHDEVSPEGQALLAAYALDRSVA